MFPCEIGHRRLGWIRFEVPIDLRRVELDDVVHFFPDAVEVRMCARASERCVFLLLL